MPDPTRPDLDALIANAKAQWDDMTDDQRRAMLAAQAESWVRGERGLDRDEAAARGANETGEFNFTESLRRSLRAFDRLPSGKIADFERAEVAALRNRAERAEADRNTAFERGFRLALEAAARMVETHGISRARFDADDGNPRPALAEAIRALDPAALAKLAEGGK